MSRSASGSPFKAEEKAELARRLRDYLRDELGAEAGMLETEAFLDFIAAEIGNAFYNRGLFDAQAAIAARLEEATDAVYALEKPTRA
ncbi:DUF2164 domain-containing protein [Stappia indica]|jgi:uncharacterized protein (DUF2164 family)|uniref:Uncharacterized conserved protein, DUF2164 family n=1 Tax=Stappia indica TaxID=538381 RepID=A0A285R9M0_9HYPH|nr:DUF2164 family protein [Stappia indica]SOB89112.1 Uncharacterized conserved protein, DUF2164 family [Stappia indica]